MRIIYVANHGQRNADDEGAITHALTSLGHTVERIHESDGRSARRARGDWMLFHKWSDLRSLKRVGIPKVFWYPDLVTFPDPTMARRNAARMAWMREVIPLVLLGACTDGDWVARDQTGKLVWLTQGADSRVVGAGVSPCDDALPPILFTGIRAGGRGRVSFVDEMTINYREAFSHITAGMYGRDLANWIAGSKIVVAPDAPVTDHYWSCRVYHALGFGAFLLHPYCAGLTSHYEDGKEIVYYRTRAELHDKIKYYFDRPEERQRITAAGLERTLREHTYTHRCEVLVSTVERRLLCTSN